MHEEPSEADQPDRTEAINPRAVIHPTAYVWLVFLSAVDVMLTALVLAAGGTEVNPLAESILNRFGVFGLVIYKFAAIAVVILLCETVARRAPRVGWWLSRRVVAIAALPVAAALWQLSTSYIGG